MTTGETSNRTQKAKNAYRRFVENKKLRNRTGYIVGAGILIGTLLYFGLRNSDSKVQEKQLPYTPFTEQTGDKPYSSLPVAPSVQEAIKQVTQPGFAYTHLDSLNCCDLIKEMYKKCGCDKKPEVKPQQKKKSQISKKKKTPIKEPVYKPKKPKQEPIVVKEQCDPDTIYVPTSVETEVYIPPKEKVRVGDSTFIKKYTQQTVKADTNNCNPCKQKGLYQ